MYYKQTEDGKIVSVRVKPRSSRAGVEGEVDDALVVRLRSAPVDGKANKELIEVLADYFNVPKSSVEFLSGETSKLKRLKIKE